MATVAAAPPHRAAPRERVMTIPLCTLVAAPGNAFTYVAPPAPAPSQALRAMSVSHATINVTYVGFDAYPQAQAAFQAAVDIWSGLLSSPVPINVQAQFTSLGTNVLGSAGAQYIWRDFTGAPTASTFYVDALADKLHGSDMYGGQFDILASFNSGFANWYFGTDGATPAGEYDFESVVLHELGHGLGFLGSANVANGSGSVGTSGYPIAFDRMTVTETGAPLLGFVNPSAALAAQLTKGYNAANPHGPGVYWGGANGVAALGGQTARLYTPSTWTPGSSYSHLDENAFPAGNPNSLMTPALSGAEAIHNPGPVTLGMFADLGWSVGASQPSAGAGDDFNADGHPDLLFESTSGDLFAWFMNGVTFSLGAALSPARIDPNIRVSGMNDFTGDGEPDVILQNQQTGAVTIDKMQGMTIVGEQTIPIAPNTPWRVVATADFNGDGHPDIAWQNSVTGEIFVWFMAPSNGWAGYGGPNGTFLGGNVRAADDSVLTVGSPTVRVAGAADLNLDGHTDLILDDDATGAVQVWYLNGLVRTSVGPIGAGFVQTVWHIRAVGDYNGDGHPDLIWENSSTFDIFAWFLNGPALMQGVPVARVQNIWTIVGPR